MFLLIGFRGWGTAAYVCFSAGGCYEPSMLQTVSSLLTSMCSSLDGSNTLARPRLRNVSVAATGRAEIAQAAGQPWRKRHNNWLCPKPAPWRLAPMPWVLPHAAPLPLRAVQLIVISRYHEVSIGSIRILDRSDRWLHARNKRHAMNKVSKQNALNADIGVK